MTKRRWIDWRMAYACWLVAVLFPSTNAIVFSGLPLDTWPEWLGMVVLLPLTISRTLADRVARVRLAATVSPVLFIGIALTALALKLCLGAFSGYHGFSSCYTSPNAAPAGQCEASFSYPFSGGRYTRYESTILRSGADWELAFLNSLRLAPPVPGPGPRDSEPFAVEFVGETFVEETARIRLVCSGRCSVSVDSGSWVANDFSATSSVSELPLEAGRRHIRVRYQAPSVNSSSSSSDPSYQASLAVLVLHRNGEVTPLRAIQPHWFARGVGLVLDAVIGLQLCTTAIAVLLAASLPTMATLWLCAVTIVAVSARLSGHTGLLAARAYCIGATSLFGIVLLRAPGWRVALRVWLWGLAVGILWTTAMFGLNTNDVWLRSIGNDPLTYESFARDILSGWSLEGGEPTFYYQPFFRYIRFFERMLFGDGEPFVIAFAFGVFQAALLAFVGVALRSVRVQGRGKTTYLSAGATAALLMTLSVTTLPMFSWPASEYPTWVMLPFALLAFRTRTLAGWALAGLSLGTAAITRVNQVLGHLALILTRRSGTDSPRVRARAVVAVAFATVLVLPLAHNLWFGGQAVAFTTSGSIPQNLTLRPERLLRLNEDSEARGILAAQVQALLYRMPYEGRSLPQTMAYHGLLAAWLIALASAAVSWLRKRGSVRRVVALASPLGFVVVHVFYQVTTYYPRHLVICYLAMGLVVLDELSQLTRDRVIEDNRT